MIPMLRSIAWIKSIHTAIFVFMTGTLVVFLYEVIINKITVLTWIAIGLFFMEGVVLMINGWKCPLTRYAEQLDSSHGQVTDIFLPKWFADRVFIIYGVLWAAALLLFAIRRLN